MALPKGKSRHLVTLDDEYVFPVKRHIAVLGLPLSHFSVLLNEYVQLIEPTLRMCADKKLSGNKVTVMEIMERVSQAAVAIEAKKED